MQNANTLIPLYMSVFFFFFLVVKKAAKYYLQNKDTIKHKVNNKYKNLPEEQKQTKREYSKNRYEKLQEKAS